MAAAPPAVQAQSSGEGAELELETPLWNCKECYVYQIPPLKNESGHRANDWNVEKWLWTGRLRLMSKGAQLKVLLEDATSGDLFASCPIKTQADKAVDPVIDSRRYFVLRIDDGAGHHAFIGMGFRDRDDAYNFNATMQDHWKSIKRQEEAEEIRKQMEEQYASQPMRDLSLKDGEKLSIKVNVPSKGAKKARPEREGGLTLGPPPGGGLLAPPPAAGAKAPPPAAPAPAPAPAPATSDDFGDFGDFAAAGEGDDDGFGDFAAA